MKQTTIASIATTLACLLLCVGCGGLDPDDTQQDPAATPEDLYEQLVPPPFYGTPLADMKCPPNEILYCTKYGYPIELLAPNFNGKLQSNTYENGVGRLVFDNDIISIPQSAFAGCNSLTYVKFPNTVKGVYSKAFDGCTSLISLYLSDNVTTFYYDALRGCSAFEVLYMNTGSKLATTSITIEDNHSFVVCVPEALIANRLNDVSFPFAIYDFEKNKLLSDYVLLYKTNDGEPAQLYEHNGKYTSIEEVGQILAANICRPSGLGALVFGYPLTTIPYLFGESDDDNSNITYIKVPTSTTRIMSDAFADTNIEEIDIPDNVERLEEFAMYGCNKLKKVTLGKGVTYIGLGVFDFNYSLEKVYCKATTPPSIHSWGIFSFYPDTFTIYVPKESLDAYLADENWQTYSERIVGYKF